MIIHLSNKQYDFKTIEKLQNLSAELEAMADKTLVEQVGQEHIEELAPFLKDIETLSELLEDIQEQQNKRSEPFEDSEEAQKELTSLTLNHIADFEDDDQIALYKRLSKEFDIDDALSVFDKEDILQYTATNEEINSMLAEYYKEAAKEENNNLPEWAQESEKQADLFGEKLCEMYHARNN